MKKTYIALSFILVIGLTSFMIFTQVNAKEENLTDTSTLSLIEVDNTQIEEMLTLAILDEYHASATYQAIMETYGYNKTFSNIQHAEETHITLLLPLLEKYGIEIPDRPDMETIDIPTSLLEAFELGVEAEILNIALYESYMDLDLPDDIQAVFLKLISGSEHHLSAFEKQASRY